MSALKSALEAIKNETNEAKNTALRIGQAFLDLLTYIDSADSSTATQISAIQTRLVEISNDIKRIVTDRTIDISTIVSKADLDAEIAKLSNTVTYSVKTELKDEGTFVKPTELTQGLNDVKTDMTQSLNSALSSYASKTSMTQTVNTIIATAKEEVLNTVDGYSYATTTQLSAKASEILNTISSTYLKSSDASSLYTSKTAYQQTADRISLLVDSDGIKSEAIIGTITDSDGNLKSSIKLKADQIEIGNIGSNVTFGGTISATAGGTIGGFTISKSTDAGGAKLSSTNETTTTEIVEEDGNSYNVTVKTTDTIELHPEDGLKQSHKVSYSGEGVISHSEVSTFQVGNAGITAVYYDQTNGNPNVSHRYTTMRPDLFELGNYIRSSRQRFVDFKITNDGGSMAREAIKWGVTDDVFSVTLNENMFPLLKEYRSLINTMSAKITALETQLNNFIEQYNSVHNLATESTEE